MIQRALLTTGVLLALYSGLIYYLGHSIVHSGQTVGQRNIVKAEDYRYESASLYDTVIVGSSMSNRLVMDSMGVGCYNLALSGLSSPVGLQLILHSEHWPQLIYVEANSLLATFRTDQIPTLSDPPAWQFIHEKIPFMRQKYQPVGVFKAVFRDWHYGKRQFVFLETGEQVDSAFFKKEIDVQIKVRQQIPSDTFLRKQTQTIYKQFDLFKKHGTQIILFEMPVDQRIKQLASSQAIHNALLDACHVRNIPFITLPEGAIYQTNDGVHLTNAECVRYTHYFCDQLRHQRVINKGSQLTAR